MSNKDTCCSLDPYFKIHKGKVREFKEIAKNFIAKTEKEKGCLYYGFSFDGNNAYCREGYEDAKALVAHVDNVGALIKKALKLELDYFEKGSRWEKLREDFLAAWKRQESVLQLYEVSLSTSLKRATTEDTDDEATVVEDEFTPLSQEEVEI